MNISDHLYRAMMTLTEAELRQCAGPDTAAEPGTVTSRDSEAATAGSHGTRR